ncbi:MAG: response regulator transcription factor [Candidatus Eisenbacteria bacterium]|uniref:Response regulator transcription factor n=1 Tax=Eiseniibacteriota bacterium TaxID=2212470 RepID=A0A538TVW4_UNCEI|nr:MAG: response regulator transcription factor [Candidatus Eisenbacteria bacterium]
MTVTRPTRVLLVDDHTLVRAGVRKILESHARFDVVGEMADGADALRLLETSAVDVLVLDLTMPGMDGFELMARVKSMPTPPRVLVLSMHAGSEHVARAVREGADGYLLKDSAVQELVAGIDALMAGRSYFSAAVQEQLGHLVRAGSANARPLDRLTERERDILKWVARGLSTKEIAARLDISPRTVDTHRANLMRKLGLRSVALLTQFALREGLVEAT